MVFFFTTLKSCPNTQIGFLFLFDAKNRGYESLLMTENISFWAKSNVSLARLLESIAVLMSLTWALERFT